MRDTTPPDTWICVGANVYFMLYHLTKRKLQKGRNYINKFLFDKQVGVYGGIYEDMKNFDKLYPEASATFKSNLADLKIFPYETPKRSY